MTNSQKLQNAYNKAVSHNQNELNRAKQDKNYIPKIKSVEDFLNYD